MNPYYSISSRTYDTGKEKERFLDRRKKKILLYSISIGAGIFIGLVSSLSPFLAVILIFGAVYLTKAYEKPILLTFLVVGSIGLTSGIERGRIVPLLAPNEIVLLLSITMSAVVLFTRRKKIPKLPPYFFVALFLIAFGRFIFPIGIFLVRGIPISMHTIFNFFSPLQYFLLYWVFLVIPESDEDRKNIIRLMIYMGMVVGMGGILQMAKVGFITNLLNTWYGSSHGAVALEVGRATSFLGGWNALGTFMMSCLFIAGAYLPDEKDAVHKTGVIFSIVIMLSTLIITTSFASAVGLVIGLIVLERMIKRFKIELPTVILFILIVAIFALLFVTVFQQFVANRFDYQYREGGVIPQTLVFRYEVWRDVFIPPILENFPLPVWPTIPESYAWGFEESQYILLLFRNGFLGLMGFLVWIGISIKWLKNKFQKSSGYIRSIIAASITIFVVLSIMGITNAVYSYSGTADFLWIMLALISNKGDQNVSQA